MAGSSNVDGADPGFRKIHSLADLDDYTEMAYDEERGAMVGVTLTPNCRMYRDVVGGTRLLQYENPPLAREHACLVLEHLPSDAVLCDMEMDPGGTYFYYRCASDRIF